MAESGSVRGASKAYIATTLLSALAWQAHMVASLFARAPGLSSLWADFGGTLPWVTQAFLSSYKYSPILLGISAALSADVLRRQPIPQKYAAWAFGFVAVASFVLHAWLTEAVFAPIFRLEAAVQ